LTREKFQRSNHAHKPAAATLHFQQRTGQRLDKRQFVEWLKSLSPDEQREFKGGLDQEELDRWKTPLFDGEDSGLGMASRRRALGVPDNIMMEDLKERGRRENAEAQFRPRMRGGLDQTIKAARRLQQKLSTLRRLEEGRPSNQPRTIVCLIAAANDEPPPSPRVSALAREIHLAERMNGLTLARLESRHAAMKSRRGPRRDAIVSLVEGALANVGLGQRRIGPVLQSEGIEGREGNPRDRVRSRQRRGGPESRRK
jgi:hypothetical protein